MKFKTLIVSNIQQLCFNSKNLAHHMPLQRAITSDLIQLKLNKK